MKVVIASVEARRSRMLRRSAGLLLVAAGLALLIAPLSHRVSGLRAQAEARRPATARPVADRALPKPGDPVGRLSVARLGFDLAVFEGVSEDALRKGPGRLPGSACPGYAARPGNCVIAGHRDSFFRPLRKLRTGDHVRLETPGGVQVYRLTGSRIVSPRSVEVVANTPDSRLTLITCYPFDWIGPAPERMVWEGVALPDAFEPAPVEPAGTLARRASLR